MDAAEIIGGAGKVCVFMEHGVSYASDIVKFTREKPYIVMEYIDAQRLIANGHGRFRLASKEEVSTFYNKD